MNQLIKKMETASPHFRDSEPDANSALPGESPDKSEMGDNGGIMHAVAATANEKTRQRGTGLTT